MSSGKCDIEYRPCPEEPTVEGITFSQFKGGDEISEIKKLNESLLSEAYSIYTYHYFVYEYPEISFVVRNIVYFIMIGKK